MTSTLALSGRLQMQMHRFHRALRGPHPQEHLLAPFERMVHCAKPGYEAGPEEVWM